LRASAVLLFVVLRVPLSFVIGLTLALILNSQHLPGRTFFRVVLFIPWATSSLAILMALVWQFFFREQGVINEVLRIFGVPGYAWLNDPVAAMAAIVAADTWFSYPFFMIVILGALQSIPADVYEAASVDGARWWTQLTRITLPPVHGKRWRALLSQGSSLRRLSVLRFSFTPHRIFWRACGCGNCALWVYNAYA
jgi:arabinogalactan oligomer/maltooligosaccharide transport system permease protein